MMLSLTLQRCLGPEVVSCIAKIIVESRTRLGLAAYDGGGG